MRAPIDSLKEEVDRLKWHENVSNVEVISAEVNNRIIQLKYIEIYDLKQSSKAEVADRIDDDREEVQKLLRRIDNKSDELVKIVRTGKKNGKDGKSRPAKAVFSGADKVAAILKNKKKIVESSTSIGPNLPFKGRYSVSNVSRLKTEDPMVKEI
ncbi:hypothetical protein HHI36_005794 [Cryptolaemus montrouzieri]|uniref:Uncharacterized protein n=1 Tax=Cryptolaemus montrouzieri TaxID=559131 RepID=A0ABD2NVE3_9CUCU